MRAEEFFCGLNEFGRDAFAVEVLDLFNFLGRVLGTGTIVSSIIGTRLAVVKQVNMELGQLRTLYPKIGLPETRAKKDYERNQGLLRNCYELGKELATAETLNRGR